MENKNYLMFVNNTNSYSPKKGIQNDYEGYKQGIAEMGKCQTITLTPSDLKFWLLKKLYLIHNEITCVETPDSPELTKDQINDIIKQQLDEDEVRALLATKKQPENKQANRQTDKSIFEKK